MSYIVTVGDRGGVFRTFERETFDAARRDYLESKERWPDKFVVMTNEEKGEVEWVDDRFVHWSGLTKEEKEALDAV